MTQFEALIVLALVAAILVALGWWLFVASEGVYLGRRVVILLYDLFASHYDEIKHYSKEYDHALLAQPVMSSMAPLKSPLVLDAATGTGRLPLALLRHKQFQGKIIGTDLSCPMLDHAVYKFEGDKRVSLLWTPAEHLPFADDTFDVVSCLEALEFMVNIEVVLHELIRVLRPGGLLFVTNRIHTRFMPGKTRSDDDMKALLKALDLEHVEIEYWQIDYNRVWARKPGKSPATSARPLAEVLRCPKCSQARLIENDQGWDCPHCHFHASTLSNGVIDLIVR